MLTLHLRGANPVGLADPDWHPAVAVQVTALCLLPGPAAVASVGVASPRNYWPATIAGAPMRLWLAAAGCTAAAATPTGGSVAPPAPTHPRRLVRCGSRRRRGRS